MGDDVLRNFSVIPINCSFIYIDAIAECIKAKTSGAKIKKTKIIKIRRKSKIIVSSIRNKPNKC